MAGSLTSTGLRNASGRQASGSSPCAGAVIPKGCPGAHLLVAEGTLERPERGRAPSLTVSFSRERGAASASATGRRRTVFGASLAARRSEQSPIRLGTGRSHASQTMLGTSDAPRSHQKPLSRSRAPGHPERPRTVHRLGHGQRGHRPGTAALRAPEPRGRSRVRVHLAGPASGARAVHAPFAAWYLRQHFSTGPYSDVPHSLAPKSCVHHGPPASLCTPTPMFLKEQLRMFALWPGLFIQDSMTAAAVRWPWAMFSP